MKLSSPAVEQILHVIETFDRERGVPHDYLDLETVLRKTEFVVDGTGDLAIGVDHPAQPEPRVLGEGDEGKQTFLEAVRGWRVG